MHAFHELKPVFDGNSKVLILGSFPSVKSREEGFFYAHKTNRFWPIMNHLFDVNLSSIVEKRDFLLSHHIALWDVIAECDIKASSDSSIRSVTPNDIPSLISKTKIEIVFLNGSTAFSLFEKYNQDIQIPYFRLPSTSSANASFSFSRLLDSWSLVKRYASQ